MFASVVGTRTAWRVAWSSTEMLHGATCSGTFRSLLQQPKLSSRDRLPSRSDGRHAKVGAGIRCEERRRVEPLMLNTSASCC